MSELTVSWREQDILRGALLRRQLRPDFHEWWPRFRACELGARLAREGVAESTLLTAANLRLCEELNPKDFRQWSHTYCALSAQDKARQCAQILRQIGFHSEVVDAVAAVNRADFVPRAFENAAFLNVSIPIVPGSNVTMFGLTALLLQHIRGLSPKRIIEVGFGTGSLFAYISKIPNLRSAEYTGFETITSLKALVPKHVISSFTKRSRGAIHWDSFDIEDEHLTLHADDLLIYSCGITRNSYERLKRRIMVTPGIVCFAPRPLSSEEFFRYAQGRLKWNGKIINTDDEYRQRFRSYMIISKLENTNSKFAESNALTNIQYVLQNSTESKIFGAESDSLSDIVYRFVAGDESEATLNHSGM